MRWLGTTAAVSIVLALSTSCLWAGEPYAFSFQPGELKYRRIFRSDGQLALPDGRLQPMKMQVLSQVALKTVSQTPDGFVVESHITRNKATLNGKEAPAPKETLTTHTFTLKPNGAVVGEGETLDFGVIFPDKPLAKGDSFTMERSGEKIKGPPTKTTYTLVETDAKLPKYPAPLSVFDAKIELMGSTKAKKVVFKGGEGKLWFDRAAGVLVRSKLGQAFDEETVLPGAKKPQTTSFSMHSDWELVMK